MSFDKKVADKPVLVLPTPEQVPPELRPLHRWCGYKLVLDEEKGKWKKPPHSPLTGEPIGAVPKWAEHWLTFDDAMEGIRKHGLDGPGFVFTEGDPYIGIDYDSCRNPETGEINPIVESWRKWFPSYTEVSVSGTGIHVLAKGKLAKARTATALPDAGDTTIEMYDLGRFFTFSGARVGDCMDIVDVQASVGKLLAYLGSEGPEPGKQQRPMSKLTARKLHQDNLIALLNAGQGEGNALLNTSAYFAARAFAAGAFEETEEQLKQELIKIVTEQWSKPHPYHGAASTVDSGWLSGVEQPLELIDDKYPDLTKLIEEFNEKFFVVQDFGGKCRVCHFKQEQGKKPRRLLRSRDFKNFRDAYLSERIQVGEKEVQGVPKPIMKTKADGWLEHRHCRKFSEVVFLPGQGNPKGMINLWSGFAYAPKKGDCGLYLAHVRDNICKADKEHYDYLIRWMAQHVRNPDQPGHVAIVVQGRKGVGKNVFAEGFGDLWGQHSIVVSGEENVTNHFNAHLRDKCVLIADEAFFAANKSQERVLKGLITGSTLTIEAKGVDKVEVPNYLKLLIVGNDNWLVQATGDERRFFVLECGDKHREDIPYFRAVQRQLDSGGYEALLYHLMYEVDLVGFEVRRAPHTKKLREQMAYSLNGFDKVWHELLVKGSIPASVDKDGTARLSLSKMAEWTRKDRRRDWQQVNYTQVYNLLCHAEKGFGFEYEERKHNVPKLWIVPALARCRELWDQKKFKVDWPEKANLLKEHRDGWAEAHWDE